MPDSTKCLDDTGALYERFFSMFATCGVAHIASKAVFPNSTWSAIYKRIRNNPTLYLRYREIAANAGYIHAKNALACQTDKTSELCRLIASGSAVYAAARQVFPDRKPRDVITAINKDPDGAADLAAAIEKRQALFRIKDRARHRAAAHAYRQKVKSDPAMIARIRELKRRTTERYRHSDAWQLRMKLLRAVSREAKALGVSTKEIHRLWKVPTIEEWRWQFVDYSKHNVQD